MVLYVHAVVMKYSELFKGGFMDWKITDFKAYESGALQGFFTLVAGLFEISNCKFFTKDGKSWVSLPQREYEKDGEKKYSPLVRIPDESRYKDFQKWAVAEIAKISPSDKPQKEQAMDEDTPF